MGRFKFKATEDQVKQMAANAANNSRPVGMGMLHYNPKKVFEASDFSFDLNYGGVFVDYAQGRMVKFRAWKKEDHWETDDEIREDYQSWIGKYPNGRALAASVPGIEVINEAV